MTPKYGLDRLAHQTKKPNLQSFEFTSYSVKIAFPNMSILNFEIGALDANNQYFQFKKSL